MRTSDLKLNPPTRGLAVCLALSLAAGCAAPAPAASPPAEATSTALHTSPTPRPTSARTPTPTRTLWPTPAPTHPPTVTPSPTPVATAELPQQLELELPDGFSLEAFELAVRPLPGEPFQPVGASAAAVLERHRGQRELEWPLFIGTIEDAEAYYAFQAIGAVGDERFYARSLAVQSEDRGMLEGVEVIRDDQVLYTIPPETMGPGLLGRLWVDGPHWYLNVLHARPVLGTELELVADVIADGQSLSERNGFDEAFNFQLLAGRPFFFYRSVDGYGFSYDGVLYPMTYTSIEHSLCCAGGVMNPLAGQDMVAFFAQRGETWYYVEAGVFQPAESVTSSPAPTSVSEVYPDPVPVQGRGAWAEGQLCPSLTDVLQPTALQLDTVLGVLQRLSSADSESARAASDPAFWRRLASGVQQTPDLAAERLSPAAPAVVSPHADRLREHCGAAVVQVSWWVEICPDDCSVAEFRSPALITHAYLLNRGGHWLVWATYP